MDFKDLIFSLILQFQFIRYNVSKKCILAYIDNTRRKIAYIKDMRHQKGYVLKMIPDAHGVAFHIIATKKMYYREKPVYFYVFVLYTELNFFLAKMLWYQVIYFF